MNIKDKDKIKMSSFIQSMINNSSFSKDCSLEIENSILIFYNQNHKSIISKFSSEQFFKNLEPNLIDKLFSLCLSEAINEKLHNEIVKITSTSISFRFLKELYKKNFNPAINQKVMQSFLEDIAKRIEIRRTLSPIIKILLNNIIDNYVGAFCSDRSYIILELEKNEKIKLSPSDISDYLKVVLILSILGNVRNNKDLNLLNSFNYQPKQLIFPNSSVREKHFQSIVNHYDSSLSYFPKILIKKGFITHTKLIGESFIPASTRITKIMYSFGKTYKPGLKADKGADTFSKSWFRTQQTNSNHFGFDLKMLDEFYRITVKNDW